MTKKEKELMKKISDLTKLVESLVVEDSTQPPAESHDAFTPIEAESILGKFLKGFAEGRKMPDGTPMKKGTQAWLKDKQLWDMMFQMHRGKELTPKQKAFAASTMSGKHIRPENREERVKFYRELQKALG